MATVTHQNEAGVSEAPEDAALAAPEQAVVPVQNAVRPLSESAAGFPCVKCGEPARVHILQGYAEGGRLIRRFCLAHAAEARDPFAVPERARSRLGLPLILGLSALIAAFLGLFADDIVLDVTQGFGPTQVAATAVGAMILLAGVVLRADLIAFCGLLILLGAIFLDELGVRRAPGVGFKQQMLLFGAAVFFLAGAVLFIRRSMKIRRAEMLEALEGPMPGAADQRSEPAVGGHGV